MRLDAPKAGKRKANELIIGYFRDKFIDIYRTMISRDIKCLSKQNARVCLLVTGYIKKCDLNHIHQMI